MKNSLKYFLLWQKKRNELPLDDDPQVDWGQMQSILDEHMPVKKSGGFKGFKTLPAIFITFSAAAMIYIAGNIYQLEKHSQTGKHHFHKSNPLQPHHSIADSSNSTSAKVRNDSLLAAYQNGAGQVSAGGALKSDWKLPATATSASNSKTNKELTTNKSGKVLGGNNIPTNIPTGDNRADSRAQSAFAGNTTGQVRRGHSGHGGHPVTSGRGNGKLPEAGYQTKLGGGNSDLNSNDPKIAAFNTFNNRRVDGTLTQSLSSVLKLNLDLNKIQPSSLSRLNGAVNQNPQVTSGQTRGNKKGKPSSPQNTKPSNIDWGILMGVNTSGSFTPKSQNANFYGSAPVDPYFGLFVSYKITDNWAIAPQVHLFSPQKIITKYTHANQSKVDSNQSLMITTAGKMYAVSVPVYAVYNTGNGLSFKAGPVINFPIKQVNTNSVLLPYSIRTDTLYFKSISTILNATRYQQNINFGFSAGVSYQFRRFIFEAAYLKSLSGYNISSGLGSFKSYNGTFQFTIGFQLDKVKP